VVKISQKDLDIYLKTTNANIDNTNDAFLYGAAYTAFSFYTSYKSNMGDDTANLICHSCFEDTTQYGDFFRNMVKEYNKPQNQNEVKAKVSQIQEFLNKYNRVIDKRKYKKLK